MINLVRRKLLTQFEDSSVPVIPPEYQQVEYLQGQGYQYILLPRTAQQGDKVFVDFALAHQANGEYWNCVCNDGGFGALEAMNGTSLRYVYYSDTDTPSGSYNVNYYDRHTATLSSFNSTITYILDDVQKFHYTTNRGYRQNPYYSLFGSYQLNRMYSISSNRIYNYKVYDVNDNVVYDVYPVKRKSDNVLGMFDIINNQFYTNRGSGQFIAGPNI